MEYIVDRLKKGDKVIICSIEDRQVETIIEDHERWFVLSNGVKIMKDFIPVHEGVVVLNDGNNYRAVIKEHTSEWQEEHDEEFDRLMTTRGIEDRLAWLTNEQLRKIFWQLVKIEVKGECLD